MKKDALSVREQQRLIARTYPSFRLVCDSELIGIWRGTLCPINRAYEVEITYFPQTRFDGYSLSNPELNVRIVDPVIGLNPRGTGEPPPHIYYDELDPEHPPLCLYDWRDDEWQPSQPIVETIIPWTSEWIYYFERWMLTGVWEGGGRSHPIRRRPAVNGTANTASQASSEKSDIDHQKYDSIASRLGTNTSDRLLIPASLALSIWDYTRALRRFRNK